MANKERGTIDLSPRQTEWVLKGAALSIAAIGIVLIPVVGVVGAIDFAFGAGMFALVEKQKKA